MVVSRLSCIGQTMPMRYPINLAEHRKAKKLSQAKLAEMIGVEQPTVQRWEVGKRTPDLEQLGDLADALGIEPGALFRLPDAIALGSKLWIKGEVHAGVWKEAYEWEPTEWRSFTGRPDVTAPLDMRFGLMVIGSSMDELYPHGTIVECVSVFGGAEITPGKRVVVVRQRADMSVEATVKELALVDGKLWARPRSSNPTFQAFPLEEPEDGIIETRIAAVVVSSVRPE